MRPLALSVAAAVLLVCTAPASADQPGPAPVSYRPPVDAPVVDPFRPPPQPWAPGNRGLEYATAPDTPVLAAADGEVVFAGPVAGSLHVVVLHPDGIRTSYSFLRSISVHRGDHVRQGQPVGLSGERLHFGARVGDVYIDPAGLFGPPEVYLVPEEERRPASEAKERAGLLKMLTDGGRRLLRVGAHGIAWARDTAATGGEAVAGVAGRMAGNRLEELRGLYHYVRESDPVVHVQRMAGAALAWWKQRGDCTPAGVPTPRLAERHLAVEVGGLGSSSEAPENGKPRKDKAAIFHVDTGALGYAEGDVVRFSYKGGTTAEHPYAPADTTVDIRQSARRLRTLLERLARENSGVPIDILAHSQGGLVARSALAYEADAGSPRRPPINALVTLGTPHHGANLATAASMFGHTAGGYGVETAADQVRLPGYELRSTSVRQLAETSEFLRRVNDRPLPPDVRVTSIGARGDLIVPSPRTHLAGAHNIVVSPDGSNQHSALPGSSAARREIALAVTGRSPTCQSLPDMVTDAAVGEAVGWYEDNAGRSLWAGGRTVTGGIDPGQLLHGGRNP